MEVKVCVVVVICFCGGLLHPSGRLEKKHKAVDQRLSLGAAQLCLSDRSRYLRLIDLTLHFYRLPVVPGRTLWTPHRRGSDFKLVLLGHV